MHSYHTLKISGLFESIDLRGISIKQAYNDHAYIEIEGIAPPGLAEQCMKERLDNEPICLVSYPADVGNKQETIFHGFIRKAAIRHTGGVYHIRIEGVSHSYFLDVLRESRSFQQTSQTFDDVIETVMKGTGCQYINSDERQSEPIGSFVLQWNETNWMFIKRLVSRHNVGLIPDIRSETPSFEVGLPIAIKEYALLDSHPYECFRMPMAAKERIENQRICGVDENDFLCYFFPSQLEQYCLGDRVHFQGLPLRIVRINSYLDRKDAVLRHDYTCTTEEGSKQPLFYNTQIQGMSLESTVIGRRKDYAKVHLFSVDKQQDDCDAMWFRQSASYTAGKDGGWCAMPELGDMLNLHFPTSDENDCYLMNSKQSSYEETTCPSINAVSAKMTSPKTTGMNSNKAPSATPSSKFLIAPNKQSMLLDDGMICFSSSGGASTLTLSPFGIQVNTDGDINMSAKSGISFGKPSKTGGIPAKGLNLYSMQNVIIVCDDSSIVLNHETGIANHYAVEIHLLPE